MATKSAHFGSVKYVALGMYILTSHRFTGILLGDSYVFFLGNAYVSVYPKQRVCISRYLKPPQTPKKLIGF